MKNHGLGQPVLTSCSGGVVFAVPMAKYSSISPGWRALKTSEKNSPKLKPSSLSVLVSWFRRDPRLESRLPSSTGALPTCQVDAPIWNCCPLLSVPCVTSTPATRSLEAPKVRKYKTLFCQE